MSVCRRQSRAAPGKATSRKPDAAAPARAIPILGYIGPGQVGHFYACPIGYALPMELEGSPNARTAATVVREIRGECLGSEFNGWLVAYDDLRLPPSRDLIGRLCVVSLADGRALIKQLQQGEAEGTFDLISLDPPIRNAAIVWAAPVKSIFPRSAVRE